jgi:hypothetical protein
MTSGTVLSGGCLCGAVRFTAPATREMVVNCHCSMCRRFHGHYGAYVRGAADGLTFSEERGLAWYASSKEARRGFCRICGSSLFWHGTEHSYVAIAAGALDQPTGFSTGKHIFVADKADYYEITDSLPQREQW